MKFVRLAAGLALVAAALACAPAAAETLVRSCASKPAVDTFDACLTSTWVRPVDAQWLVVNRRNVVTNVWVRPTELVELDRVYACTVDTIVPGTGFGAGCVNGAGVKVRLPGRTDNWLLHTELSFRATVPPPVSSGQITVAWDAVIVDSEAKPFGGTAGYVVNRQQDLCTTVAADPRCGTMPWISENVGNVTSKVYTGLTGRWCFTVQGYVGAGGIGELGIIPANPVCGVPGQKKQLPGEVQNIRVTSEGQP